MQDEAAAPVSARRTCEPVRTTATVYAAKANRYPLPVRSVASVLMLGVPMLCGLVACQAADFTYAGATNQESDASTSGPSTGPSAPDGGTPSATPSSPHVDVLAPGGLDFGDVGCGTSSPTRTIEIHNGHDASIEVDAVVADAEIASVTPTHASIAAGSSIALTVSTTVPRDARPAEEATSVTITTNAPSDAPHTLPVRRSIVGAVFTTSRSGVIDFYAVATSKSTSFDVHNEGNLPGVLTLELSSTDTFSAGPATLSVPAGGSARVSVGASPPNGGSAARSATLRFSSESIVCGGVPANMSLRCRRND